MTQLPEIAEYHAHIERVNAATAEVEEQVYRENPLPGWDFDAANADARRTVRTRRGELLAETYERQSNGYAKALDALKASENPLIQWTIEHTFEEYRGEALQLLSALTVDGDHLAEMDERAEALEFCNVYRTFRRQAIADGVLVEKDPARKELLRVLRHHYTTENANLLLDAHDREVTERVVLSPELVSASE